MALPSRDPQSQVGVSYSTPLAGGPEAHTPAMTEAKKECSGFHRWPIHSEIITMSTWWSVVFCLRNFLSGNDLWNHRTSVTANF